MKKQCRYNNSMKTIKITNRRRQFYLEEHGIYPVYTYYDEYYYERTAAVLSLLEDCAIVETFYASTKKN